MNIWLARIEFRQFAGVAILAGLVFFSYAVGTDPLSDLDGMFGLILPLAIGLTVPRSWLPATFWVIACYFLAQGIYWLVLDKLGLAKSPLYWMADVAAAGIFIACARLSTSAAKKKE